MISYQQYLHDSYFTKVNGFFSSFALEVNISEILSVPEILQVPERSGTCDKDILWIANACTSRDLSECGGGSFLNGISVVTIKAQKITDTFDELIERTARMFYSTLEYNNWKLDEVYQIVEIPWVWLDQYPGDTRIFFTVFTKRQLMKY